MFTATLSDNHRLTAKTATLLTQKINSHIIANDAVVTSLEYTRKGSNYSLSVFELARVEEKERARTTRKLLASA